MDPRSQFYLEVIGGVAAGLFFVGFGAYGVNISLGNLNNSQRLLYAGAGCIALGLILIWKFLQYLRPLKPKSQLTVIVCPGCGAVIEENTERCPKCGKIVAN